MPGADHHIPESQCLQCGNNLNGVFSTQVERRPIPGDPIACIRCAAVMTCDESGRLRPFTEEEFAELQSDRKLMDSLRLTVGNIRIMHADMN